MEFKINQGTTDRSSQRQRNNIFRRFREPLTSLLSQTRNRQDFPELDKIYIENTSIHEQLDYFSNDKQNIAQFLVGLTGIGKTTTIRGYFGIDRSAAIFRNKTLLLPIFVDGAAIYKNGQIEGRLRDLFWNGCKELDPNLGYDDDDFYKFVYDNSPYVLAEHEDPKNTDNSKTLEKFQRGASRAFYIELLKYYFLKNDINSVVLIIDDIESIKNRALLSEFVHLAAKSWDCLQNNDSSVYIKLLIAERPETHANLFRKEPWFTAFGFRQDTIDLMTPPPLAKIFQKRFDYLTESESGEPAKDMEEWRLAYGVLVDICDDISINNQEVITALCNHNIRKSLAIFLELLTAGFWLQKNEQLLPYFKLRKGQFRRPSNILILKALGYRNNEHYINSDNQLISNLLHYRRNCAYPLLVIQLVRCFLAESEKADSRFLVLSKSDLLKKIKSSITPQVDKSLDDASDYAIEYLTIQEILLVSSVDDGSGNYIYLSPKGEILWKLIGDNTILLELFRDDMWLNSDKHTKKSIRKATLDTKFYEVINLARGMISEEKSIIDDLVEAGSISVYQDLFGDVLASSHIANGVLESLSRFYNSNDNNHVKPESIANNSIMLTDELTELNSRYLEIENEK